MPMKSQPRVGLFGGTFNPVHIGHLRAAEEVCDQLELSELRLVPSAQPPHKRDSDDNPIAPAALRLRWTELAVANNPRLTVDPVEIERGGRSFTIDTVRRVSERTGEAHPVFVIGWDAFVLIDSWREPEALLAEAHFAVMTRPPRTGGNLREWIPTGLRDAFEVSDSGLRADHREAPTSIRVLDIPALDISSSGVRARLRRGDSVRYLLPEAVRQQVQASGVFECERAIVSVDDG